MKKFSRESLDHFEKWYGPYPYKTLTVVDPEPDSAAGGMEYPTFITGDIELVYAGRIATCRNSSWSTSSGTSTGTAWSRPTNSKMPGWTKASTATPK